MENFFNKANGEINGAQCDGVLCSSCAKPDKLIIDTDPGIGEIPSLLLYLALILENKCRNF